MQPLRISFRVSPFPTTFPSFFTLLLRLSLVVVITRPRCGRTLKPFRSDIFIFFFSFFPSTFFLFGSPGGSILLRFFFGVRIFLFLPKKYFTRCRSAMDFLLLRVFFCCVLPGFQLAGRILFFWGVFLFVCSASFTQFPIAGCGPSWAARYAVGR